MSLRGFEFGISTAWGYWARTWKQRTIYEAGETFVIRFFGWFGELGKFCWRLARVMFVPPLECRELLRQMDMVGAKSLPLVALAGAATGVVMSLQMRDSLTRFGAKGFLPAVIIFSLLEETGQSDAFSLDVPCQR